MAYPWSDAQKETWGGSIQNSGRPGWALVLRKDLLKRISFIDTCSASLEMSKQKQLMLREQLDESERLLIDSSVRENSLLKELNMKSENQKTDKTLCSILSEQNKSLSKQVVKKSELLDHTNLVIESMKKSMTEEREKKSSFVEPSGAWSLQRVESWPLWASIPAAGFAVVGIIYVAHAALRAVIS